MNICVLTRDDIFPTNHGAAVKIVQTVENLSQLIGGCCCVVTANRDRYWKCEKGYWKEKAFSPKTRAMQEWPFLKQNERWANQLCRYLGYPEEEFFLYASQFDIAWLIRALAVGLSEDCTIFQAEFPGYGMVASSAAKILEYLTAQKVQSAIVQHNVEWLRLKEFGFAAQRMKVLEKRALQNVDQVIAVSQEDKNHMISMGIDAQKVTVIPHGVRPHHPQQDAASYRQKYGISKEQSILFFHGTLHYAPNTEAVQFIAEKMIPLLEEENLDYRIVITGMNPPLYYSHPRIVFTDVVDDLAGHIEMADICICPLFAGGGTRLKLLEYMAAGKPIITTPKGAEGIPDQGQFVYAKTGTEFVGAILEIVKSFSQKRSNDVAVKMANQLTWSKVTQCYVDLYQGVGQGENHFQRLLSADSQITDFLPSTYRPAKDLTMLLLVNRGCNLRCTFCDLWDNHQHMPLEQIVPLFDQAVQIGTKVVVITGGEPLLHPDIRNIILAAKERGLAVNMTTNGVLLEKYWAKIMDTGIDSLSFSIDGLEEIHDQLRGQKGAFAKTMQAMKRVRLQTQISCSVYFVVTNQNLHQLWEVYQMVTTIGCDFDFWPVNDAPDLYLKTQEDQKLWLETVQQIISDNPKYKNRWTFYEDGVDYHLGLRIRKNRCLGYVEQYGITYAGDFLPCCVWGERQLVSGNVFEESLISLWKSEKIQQLRKQMVDEGCSVQCFNHSLYEYIEATSVQQHAQSKMR